MSNKDFPLLKLLIQVMEEVVEHNLDFQMEYFFVFSGVANQAKNIHTCGTPACVVGYGAVSPEVQNYLKADISCSTATYIAEMITNALVDEIGQIAYSVFGSFANNRAECAFKYLSKRPIGFRHLIDDNPKAEDTLKYMKYVLEIKQQEE